VRLRYNEVLSEHFSGIVPADQNWTGEFGKEFIGDLSLRRKELASFRWKLALYGSLPTFLLFMSIVGIKWEVHALGVSLTDLESIKEIIFIFGTCITSYLSLLEYRDFVLKCIIQGIGTKYLGAGAFGLYKFRLAAGSHHEFDLPLELAKSPYIAPRRVAVIFLTLGMSLALSFVLSVAVSLIPSIVVAYDIWMNPTWPPLVSRVAVSVCVVAFLLSIAFTYSLHLRYRFLDVRKILKALEAIVNDREATLKKVMEE
jgi:hypothetical protein